MSSQAENINAALAQLDHDNDDHWLADGSPRASVVQRIAKDNTITRAHIGHIKRHANAPAAEAVEHRPFMPSGNAQRVSMTKAAIKQTHDAGDDITPETLAVHLPDDFGIDMDDIAEALGEQVPYAPDVPMNGHAADPASVVDGQHLSPVEDIADPHERAAAAERLVEVARHDKRMAENAVMAARQSFARALAGWQHENPPESDLQVRRAFIATEQAKLAAKKAGLGPRGPVEAPPRSVVDALGRGSRGGSIDQNYGPGFRRGSQPASRRGAYDARFDKRLKLPSER